MQLLGELCCRALLMTGVAILLFGLFAGIGKVAEEEKQERRPWEGWNR